MSAVQQEEIKAVGLEEVFSDAYLSVFADAQKNVLLCQTRASYIPMKAFQATFQKCAVFVEQHKIEKFIFDKRSLRAFHQPSMEWYFVHWKQELYRKIGLRKHRKILPAEPWFQKCVEAGRHEIQEKHPHNIFSELDIVYTSSIEEAMAD